MASSEVQTSYRVLLVDDDRVVLGMMSDVLKKKGFEVVATATVAEALRSLAAEKFDVLITDLHMPNPGDGFTVISAMRHSQPNALTILVSGYPDVRSAMAAILLEADEIIVKPFEIAGLADLIRDKMRTRRPAARVSKEGVGTILQRCVPIVIREWLQRTKQSSELNHLLLSDDERTGHLPKLVEDLIVRLRAHRGTSADSDAIFSSAAVAHGKLRFLQGYSPAMLVHESRILQVTIFGTLQNNLNCLDFSLLLPDVMTIADELEAQLTQSMNGFMDFVKPRTDGVGL